VIMADNGKTLIEISGITKHYSLGETVVKALNGVDFQVKTGEMVAITGASGSGKSTLMHILGCLDRPDSGNYLLAGENVATMSKDQLAYIRNHRIGFVFQTFNLLPRMNAQENVELPLLYAGLRDAKDRAAEALQRVGLADRMHHQPNQLSGGQRQRVAIARALVTKPDLILADEPTGNLDTRTGDEIMALLKQLNDGGGTLILVTHEADIARQCRREVRLRNGQVIKDELLEK